MPEPEPFHPEAIEGSSVLDQGAWVTGVELDGEGVLYDEDTGAMHVLNPTATVIWSYLDGATPLDAVADELSEAFHADVAMVRRDVIDTAVDFARKGLLAGVVRPEVTSGGDEASRPEAPRFLEEPAGG